MNLFGRSFPKSYVILIVLCLLSLSLRLWLIDKRWVNVDEGAHLMDAALVLDGWIPLVDFESRQPLYVYVLAGFLKVLGINYIDGRLYAVTFSLLTGLMIFLLARSLFDQQIAFIATVAYWMMPFEVLQSTVVKMEPLATFLNCTSLYCLVRFLQKGGVPWMIMSGVCWGLAFYVRQSALATLLTVSLFLVIYHRRAIVSLVRDVSLFLIGCSAVVMIVAGFYSVFMSLRLVLLNGAISPIGYILGRLGWTADEASLATAEDGLVDPERFAAVLRSIGYWQLSQVLDQHAFLLVGLGLALLASVYRLYSLKGRDLASGWGTAGRTLMYCWVLTLAAAYTHLFLLKETFYVDYFRELVPPMVIIVACWLRDTLFESQPDESVFRFVLWGLCFTALVFAVQARFRMIGIGHLVSLGIALCGLFYFYGTFQSRVRQSIFTCLLLACVGFIALSRHDAFSGMFSGIGPSLLVIVMTYCIIWISLERRVRDSLETHGKFALLSVLFASFLVSMSFSAFRLNLAYEGVWSPIAVEQVSAYLRQNTSNDDEVMSGGVIWEYQSQRKPFQMISHPLAFEYEMSQKRRTSIETALHSKPPKVIIMDGYTEMTYLRHVGSLREFVKDKYKLAFVMEGAGHGVEVYRLLDSLASS